MHLIFDKRTFLNNCGELIVADDFFFFFGGNRVLMANFIYQTVLLMCHDRFSNPKMWTSIGENAINYICSY